MRTANVVPAKMPSWIERQNNGLAELGVDIVNIVMLLNPDIVGYPTLLPCLCGVRYKIEDTR